MTKAEQAEYNIHNALHGEVESITSTKGLLEDKVRVNLDKGPIASFAPWFDYNGDVSENWLGDNYQNTLYGTNFMDAGINGKFRDNKTTFRIMVNVGKEIAGNNYMQSFVDDLYIMRQMTKHNKILLGNTRDKATFEGGDSPFTIPFFSRSQISRTYGNARSFGLKAIGNYDLWEYNASFTSSERFFKDFFPGPEFTGWLGIKPLGKTDGRYGKLTLAGNLNAGNAQSHYNVEGAYLCYEYKRLKLTTEYATADGSNGSTGFTSNRSEGYYGTIAYRLTSKFQALLRYDKFDPNKDVAGDMRTEYTAGINYFIRGQALKLMVNYVYYTLENGGYGNRILVGTQVIL